MKMTLVKTVSLLMMALMLAMSFAAYAEETSAVETAPTAEASDTSEALDAALSAYKTAKNNARITDYEAELKEMVANGQLTQEQADLLLKAANDAEAIRNGICPGCGYAFSSSGRSANHFGGGTGMRVDGNSRSFKKGGRRG